MDFIPGKFICYALSLLSDRFFETIAYVPFLCYSLRQIELNKKTTPKSEWFNFLQRTYALMHKALAVQFVDSVLNSLIVGA